MNRMPRADAAGRDVWEVWEVQGCSFRQYARLDSAEYALEQVLYGTVVGLTGLGSAEMYEPWNSLAPSDIDPDRPVRGDQSRVTVPWAMPTTAAMAATSTTATTTHSKALKIRPWLRIRVST